MSDLSISLFWQVVVSLQEDDGDGDTFNSQRSKTGHYTLQTKQ